MFTELDDKPAHGNTHTPTGMIEITLQQANIRIRTLNQASVEELASQLKGIGRQRAQAMVDYREKRGPLVFLEQ